MGINTGTEYPTGSTPQKNILDEKERSLKDLFHLIKEVLPEEQTLIKFSPEMPVIEALNEMRRHNYSQVPVRARAGLNLKNFNHPAIAFSALNVFSCYLANSLVLARAESAATAN